jgi:hypothetical protein
MKMHKKYIASVLISALLIQLYGCYSMQDITKDEMAGLKDGGDLIVHTQDSKIYFFEESNYHISNDSLYGKGYVKSDYYASKVATEGTIALTNIESIQQDKFNLVTTLSIIGGTLLVVGVGFLIFVYIPLSEMN